MCVLFLYAVDRVLCKHIDGAVLVVRAKRKRKSKVPGSSLPNTAREDYQAEGDGVPPEPFNHARRVWAHLLALTRVLPEYPLCVTVCSRFA